MKKYLLIFKQRYSSSYSVEEFDSAADLGDYLFTNKVDDPIIAQRLAPKFELIEWQAPQPVAAAAPEFISGLVQEALAPAA